LKSPRKFLADITAAVIFFTVAAMLTELLIVKLTLTQSIEARTAAIIPMALAARPFGMYRDWMYKVLHLSKRGAIANLLLETATFISFQLPIYVIILFYVGATLEQIAIACGAVVVLMAIVARPFGLFLNLVRKLFGVSELEL
jgi:hypothetical protein